MEDNSTIEKLSETDVMDIIKMANTIYNAGNMFGVFTPQLLNQNLNSLNNNAFVPDKKSLDDALKNYKHQSDVLQSYNEFAEVYDSLFRRTIEYYVGLLSFDLHITCKNAYKDSDYISKEYLDDQRRVDKFFDNFDLKSEFRKVLKNMVRNEIFYTWFRDSRGDIGSTGEISIDEEIKSQKLSKYTLQIMPQEYCLYTDLWEKGILFDVNMYYFMRAGVDINGYAPVFKKYLNETLGTNNDPHYNPTAPLNDRTGSFSLWTQTSPDDGAWCFKFDMANLNATPFLSSLIRQVLTNSEIAKLQTDANFLAARAIIAGQIPLMDKQTSGQNEDAMAWKATTLQKFLSLVKMGLQQNMNAVAMPTEDNDFYQYENKNPDMYEKQLNISAGTGVSASRLIYSTGKMSVSEIENAIYTDYMFMSKVYPQFKNFLEFYVNQKTRKYKFNFDFKGSSYPFIREIDKKNLLDLADKGIVLNESAYSGIVDMTPTEFRRSLFEGKHSKWTEDLLSQLLSIHTQSGKGEVGQGAPKKDSSDLKDGGGTARDYES